MATVIAAQAPRFLYIQAVHFGPLWFWGLTRELGEVLAGGRIRGGRVFAAGVVLTCESNSAADLIFWLDPRFPRVECLPSRGAGKLPEGWRPLLGASVAKVSQPDHDRRMVVNLTTEASELTLDYRAFPRPSLVLKDAQGGVLLCVGVEPTRTARPAQPFLMDILDSARPEDPRAVRGLEDLWLEAAFNSGRSPWEFVVELARNVSAARPSGFVVMKDGKAVGVSQVDLSAYLPGVTFEDAGGLSHASSRFVSEARKREDEREERTALLAVAQDLQSRLARTHRELEKDRARQEGHGEIQENADALTAQLSNIKKGQKTITVQSATGERTVALDPRQRPHDQADRWYQDARRLRRGMEATEERLEKVGKDLARLDVLLRAVQGKVESEDEKVAAAFVELGRLAKQSEKKRPSVRTQQEPVRFRRYRSPGGLAIWVGRNNHENDELTLHAAHKEDLWFHAQQCPGSHVILRSHALGQAPAQPDVLAAAATAAYYSKARTSKKVPVIYTIAKYVRKPRQAAAGAVKVEREKSVMVEPRLCPEWDEPV